MQERMNIAMHVPPVCSYLYCDDAYAQFESMTVLLRHFILVITLSREYFAYSLYNIEI